MQYGDVFLSPLRLNGRPVWYAVDWAGQTLAIRIPDSEPTEREAILELVAMVTDTGPAVRLVNRPSGVLSPVSLSPLFGRLARPQARRA